MPDIDKSDLYTFDFESARDAGKYTVSFTLTDEENYAFENGIDEAVFEIQKAPITLEVDKKGKGYSIIAGTVYDGDSLGEEYYTEDGIVYIKISNPNYDLSVIPFESDKSGKYVWIVFIICLSLILTAMSVYIGVTQRRRIAIAFGNIKSIVVNKMADISKAKAEPNKKVHKEEEELPLETLLAVDELHANTLISDSLAKNLLTNAESPIVTDGNKRYIVNIDTISDSFEAGNNVDINSMKEKGIIPKDAKYVKVLARGVIDKPINIIANSFSLSAVKMIALTGGTAKRAHTVSSHNKK
jgi:ribosomal protein L15